MAPSKSYRDENRFGGSWSREKLDCVQSYIERYLEVMTNQRWADLWYIDAFSGDGIQRLKSADGREPSESLFSSDGYSEEVKGFITGSALRAIESSVESGKSGHATFSHYVFIEMNKNKLKNLHNSISRCYPRELPKYQFIPEDVNKRLPKVLADIDWAKGRAVCFIDPFATQLQWSTLQSFDGTKADIWLLSPLSAIIRQLPCNRMPDDAICKRLDHIFGDDQWRTLYHAPANIQLPLFDLEESSEKQFKREPGVGELIDYMTKRYKSITPYVFGPAILRTKSNAPFFSLYGLVTNKSPNATIIAGRIMKNLIHSIGGD